MKITGDSERKLADTDEIHNYCYMTVTSSPLNINICNSVCLQNVNHTVQKRCLNTRNLCIET